MFQNIRRLTKFSKYLFEEGFLIIEVPMRMMYCCLYMKMISLLILHIGVHIYFCILSEVCQW